jgi:hypothetical protein
VHDDHIREEAECSPRQDLAADRAIASVNLPAVGLACDARHAGLAWSAVMVHDRAPRRAGPIARHPACRAVARPVLFS